MVSIVVMTHSVITFWYHFHPRSTKSMDLETFPQFATPNHRKSENCAQSILWEGPQIRSKIIKNGHLGISVTIGCPPGPRITKMVSQVLRKSSRRL